MAEEVTDHRLAARKVPPVLTINAAGKSPFVLVCDHASNRIPERYRDLGLTLTQRLSHIAWDPGALSVCHALVDLLDAPLVHSTVSRLVIDCNRDVTSPGLIWTLSEATGIAANVGIDEAERARRITEFHAPFHQGIDALLESRKTAGLNSILICMHSFTPAYHGVARPWPIGLIHGKNTAYTRRVYDALRTAHPDLNIGWNEPYAALNGVTLTLEQHGDGRDLDATMIEIRNNEILEPDGIAHWATLLARCLETAREGGGRAMAS